MNIDIKRLKELMSEINALQAKIRESLDRCDPAGLTDMQDELSVLNSRMRVELRRNAPALIKAYEDEKRLRAALNHQRSALALVRDRQCHDGVCTIAIADLEQGIRQIDAAMRDKP